MTNQEIRQLRNRLGLSQCQFAEKLHWSKSYLSMIETGKRAITKAAIERINQTFCVDGGILPMQAKIDFLRIRFKIHSSDQVIEKVLRMNPDVFIYKNYGFNHYTETYCFSEIFVFANPENLDMGVMIELRGRGCREYELVLEEQQETWTEFFWRLYETNLFGDRLMIDTKITRIDLALDEQVSLLYPNYDLFELKEKYEQGLVDTTFRNFDFTGGIVVKNGQRLNKGLSLYFGSRQSPFYLNFYQKDYELAKKEEISVEMARQKYGIKNRYEIRLADEKAYLFVEYLLSTGETLEWVVKELIDTAIKVYDCDEAGMRTQYSANWRMVIESMQELKLTMKGEKPNYEKSLRWLSNYLAPTLKKIWIMDQTFGTDELMTRIKQAELKEKDQEELAKLTTTIKELLIQEEEEAPSSKSVSVTQQEVEQLLAQFLFE
ncbi:helix-turn-helix domain-containing protein [Enterococcus faecalis]|uniref:replication initiation factor domain-containing protein n=1 Tax=Enterococcus TaxID=1350 RepID=UPI001A007236|nr:helix-turn-helix domain-containing protein [Enterococcus faecalis]EGO7798445.1 helix-turn-helix domain-containing protein [Enterococcus faecalis]EIX6391900.1 replication initiation factor domain-containing protein [Enterococcus faecalis]HAP3588347.1 helix-turn-helix domain-containing protein [Enterococcus faecalis]HBI2013615.1 replication initiation factor domain-containing protein [Enterococcus faecalis]